MYDNRSPWRNTPILFNKIFLILKLTKDFKKLLQLLNSVFKKLFLKRKVKNLFNVTIFSNNTCLVIKCPLGIIFL